MPRKAKADMTLAQKNNLELNKFRADIRAEHLEEARVATRNDDIAAFRKTAYKEALRDAKAQRQA